MEIKGELFYVDKQTTGDPAWHRQHIRNHFPGGKRRHQRYAGTAGQRCPAQAGTDQNARTGQLPSGCQRGGAGAGGKDRVRGGTGHRQKNRTV